MVDISREGNEQLAGERDDRDAASPAALGADALAEPTAKPNFDHFLTEAAEKT